MIKLKLTVFNDSNFDEFITLSFGQGQGHFVSHVHLKKTPISGPSYPQKFQISKNSPFFSDFVGIFERTYDSQIDLVDNFKFLFVLERYFPMI